MPFKYQCPGGLLFLHHCYPPHTKWLAFPSLLSFWSRDRTTQGRVHSHVRLPTGCAPSTQLSMVVVHTHLLDSRHHQVALDVLREFKEMAKEENANLFAKTASKRQITACQ